MIRQKHPLYQRGIIAYLEGNADAFTRLRKQPGLSISERRLLEARALFRGSRFSDAISLLKPIHCQGSKFLEAERLFLLATAHNHQGGFEEALFCNHEAHAAYLETEDRRGLFLSAYNLSVDYGRIGLLRLSEEWIRKARDFAQTPDEQVLIHRARACQAGKQGHPDEASKHILEALAIRSELKQVDREALDTVASDVFFRAGRWSEALDCLSRLRSRHSNRERARVDFEWKLMGALLQDKLLGLPGAILSRSPAHLLKWKLLKAIQGGEHSLAHVLWKALAEGAPQVYGVPFHLTNGSDRQSIFGVYLEKQLRRKSRPATLSARGRLSRLLETLRTSQIPMRKEELIEKVWNIPYSPDMDARLYKLIQRLRGDRRYRIISQNRAYRLIGDSP